jgi:hypothetical protein
MCYIEPEGARHDPVSLLQCLALRGFMTESIPSGRYLLHQWAYDLGYRLVIANRVYSGI